jgi:hypothetical protein
MIAIKRSEIPEFLQGSDFYRSLNEEDDEEMMLDEHHLKLDAAIDSEHALEHQLSMLKFWGTSYLSEEQVKFCLSEELIDLAALVAEHSDNAHLKVLHELQQTPAQHRLHVAFRYGNLTIVSYLHNNGYAWTTESVAQAALGGHLHLLQ